MRRKGPGLGESWRRTPPQTARAQPMRRGSVSPLCARGVGEGSGSLLTSGQLGSRRAWALGLCPHPYVSLRPRSPCACPSPVSQGISWGAAHPPWSLEPRALAIFWVLEAMGKTAQRPVWTCFSSAWLEGASPGIADPQGTLLWPSLATLSQLSASACPRSEGDRG